MAAAPTDEHAESHEYWDAATTEELRVEDSTAWKNVVGVLLAIVCVGLVLAVMTVFLSA
jgi:hypothetical protein